MEAVPNSNQFVTIKRSKHDLLKISSLDILPVIDVDIFTKFSNVENNPSELIHESKIVAECFHKYGIVVVKDSVNKCIISNRIYKYLF